MNELSRELQGNEANTLLPAVNFQFLYQRTKYEDSSKEFNSKKKTLIDAMDDFLTRKKRMFGYWDINEEVQVTYKDGSQKFILIDVRQNWDTSWYFVYENQMICGNGYSCQFNGR